MFVPPVHEFYLSHPAGEVLRLVLACWEIATVMAVSRILEGLPGKARPYLAPSLLHDLGDMLLLCFPYYIYWLTKSLMVSHEHNATFLTNLSVSPLSSTLQLHCVGYSLLRLPLNLCFGLGATPSSEVTSSWCSSENRVWGVGN